MQQIMNITELNEENPNRVFAQRALDRQVIGEITAIAILHHQVDIVLWLFAVEKRHNVLMMQLGQLLEYFDFLAEKILRLCQALLGDALYGHGETRFLQKRRDVGESISKRRFMFVVQVKRIMDYFRCGKSGKFNLKGKRRGEEEHVGRVKWKKKMENNPEKWINSSRIKKILSRETKNFAIFSFIS